MAESCNPAEAFRYYVRKAQEFEKLGTAEGDFAAAALYYSAAVGANCLGNDPRPLIERSKRSRIAYKDRFATAATSVPAAPGTTPRTPERVPDRLPATLQADPQRSENPEIRPLIPESIGIDMDRVAGNETAKRVLRQVLINPFNFPQLYPDGILIDGIMMYGVAGTGKTTLAAAAAKSIQGFRTEQEVQALRNNPKIPGFVERYFPDSRVPRVLFYSATVPDITSMYVGEPARKMKRFFQMARETQPSVVFFDEGETYLDPSDEHNSGTIATFKQETGGVASKGLLHDMVVVIVATNYPMRVEAAIRSRLAPGALEVRCPDFKARAKIAALNFERGAWKAGQAEQRQKRFGVQFNATTPDPLVQYPEDMANLVACLTQPPDEANPERIPWSGRDIESLVKTAYLANRTRVIGGFVQRCRTNCLGYPRRTFANAYQEVGIREINQALGTQYRQVGELSDSDRRTLKTKDIVSTDSLTDEERLHVLATPLTVLDLRMALQRTGPSVDKGAVRAQMQFNEELGHVVAEQGFWQKLYQDPTKPRRLLLGKNTTIPDPDGKPVDPYCAELVRRLV